MRHMNWTINGSTFRMQEVANEEKVRMNSFEVWEFINEGSGMGMMGGMNMPHPMHLHGKQFQVLERQGVTHEGYVDEGWKDTVLLMPARGFGFWFGLATTLDFFFTIATTWNMRIWE
jgi:hypothetical protein